MEDVVIIGGGVIGCAVARALSRYELKITLIEKEEDVAAGTSKANSAVVHAGFDAKPGTWKARMNVRGNALYPALCRELDVPFKRLGSLVVALEEEEISVLVELLERGRQNGVEGLAIVGREELLRLEPNLNPRALAALYAPTAGIVCPYELTVALAESAYINGVKFFLDTMVTGVKVEAGTVKGVETTRGLIPARFVVNAAGLYADEISRLAGAEEYTITPRKGEYLLFDKTCGALVRHSLFPTPSPVSKGIMVCPTVDGNLFIGPNARDVQDKTDLRVTTAGIEEIIAGGRKLVPNLPLGETITSFAGLRAVAETDDFVIGASRRVKGFINVGGIQSPGLASAPAIAEMVVAILREEGLALVEKENFVPGRPVKHRFRELSAPKRQELIEGNPAWGRVVCRCELVTEAEVVEAIRRPPGARSLDGVKRRTRAGMGRCQGGFCSPRVLAILARELGVDPLEVTKCGGGSEILKGRTKEFLLEGGLEDDDHN
ncbi:MAG: NAD(P)/FAD-dependent oxidoreductase [Bacillota bacterium]